MNFYLLRNQKLCGGDDFDQFPAGLCVNLTPNEEDYDTIKIIKTNIKLSLIQDSTCFGMQDAMDGIVAIGYEDISDYEEYPEDGRLILHYGISYDECEELLANKNIVFE